MIEIKSLRTFAFVRRVVMAQDINLFKLRLADWREAYFLLMRPICRKNFGQATWQVSISIK